MNSAYTIKDSEKCYPQPCKRDLPNAFSKLYEKKQEQPISLPLSTTQNSAKMAFNTVMFAAVATII